MSVFTLDDDARAFMLRATASLERLDGAVAEAQLTIVSVKADSHALMQDARETLEQVNALIAELRDLMASFRAGVGKS